MYEGFREKNYGVRPSVFTEIQNVMSDIYGTVVSFGNILAIPQISKLFDSNTAQLTHFSPRFSFLF